MTIRSVGVLGAGTMGAQIALHLANAGVPSVLLDVSRDAARQGLERARRLKPDPQFTPDAWTLVTTGGFDEDLARLAGVDWVVEAVVERLDVKRTLLEKVAAACRPDAVLSTNTSGIPVGAIAEGWPAERRARWLGTHFFNPPRYLSLLELIPLPDTAPDVLGAIVAFGDRVLGKGVVVARDTPNFIANHLALHGVAAVLRAVESGRYTIDEVDAITGKAIGRPASATSCAIWRTGSTRRRIGPGSAPRTCWPAGSPPAPSARRPAAASTNGARTPPAPPRSSRSIPPPATTSRSASRRSRRSTPPAASTTSAPGCARCSSATTASAHSCARRWRPHWSTPRASRPRSRTRSTTSIGRCAGASGGIWAHSS